MTVVCHFSCSRIQGIFASWDPTIFQVGKASGVHQLQPSCQAVSAVKSEVPWGFGQSVPENLTFPTQEKDSISDRLWVTGHMNTHHNVSQQSIRLQQPWPWDLLSWSGNDADNTKVVGSIPVWAIHLGVELDNPCGSLISQNILWSVT